MDCREAAPLLPRWADGELDPGLRGEVDAHLAGCPACREAGMLYRKEAALLAVALRGGARAGGRGRFRTAAVAAVLLPLAFVALTGLLRVYESAMDSVAAAKARAAADARLDREVLVRAEGVPLTDFVAMLAEEAEVGITIADGVIDRLGGDPEVHITLAEPLRLRHLLGLLELFYGLRTTVDDGRIRLE